ncbi:MAG: DUF4440 domain-containing protein [Alphaproteobacteria bacterium]|nr:DUF4440 domain-containing protein [Alphaproteobacteria bacterium]
MNRIVLAACACLAVGAAYADPKPAQDYSGLPADLAASARAFDEAQVASDGAALKALLADDYVLVGGAGNVETRAGFIADYTDPDVRFQPFQVVEQVKTVWSDGAVLGGKVTIRLTDHGKPAETTFRFADVWAKRHGKWQIVYTGVTRLPAS